MTTYADTDTRKTWRINYGIPTLRSSRDAAYYWGRRGGAPSGCVLALAQAIEQIDADEALLRQALDMLTDMPVKHPSQIAPKGDLITALKERLT